MLELVSDYLKSNIICKNAVKRLTFPIRYVPNQYKTREMCDKVILENGEKLMFLKYYWLLQNQKLCNKAVDNYPCVLEFVSDCFKDQKVCNKAVDTYPSAMQFVLECYKTHEMCDKVVDACPFIFDSFPVWYKSQQMCDKAFSNNLFMLKYCLDRCNTQKMCDKD